MPRRAATGDALRPAATLFVQVLSIRAPGSRVKFECNAARATHDGRVCGGAQDVYRRLTASAALGGLLRVRLSPELRVARAYGPLAADERCLSPRWQHLDCLIAASGSVCIRCDSDKVAGVQRVRAQSGDGAVRVADVTSADAQVRGSGACRSLRRTHGLCI